jgi:hypothetical protein
MIDITQILFLKRGRERGDGAANGEAKEDFDIDEDVNM